MSDSVNHQRKMIAELHRLSAEREKTARPSAPPRTMRAGVKQGETGINRLLARLRHVFSWAIVEGYTTETPFKRHGVSVIKLEMKAETARTRRLEPGEEDALRAAASPHLRALIVAALSTGCRLGELLSLQWRQIRVDDQGVPRWILLTADRTKTNKNRTIPVGPRLRAELDMRKTDPEGKPFGPDCRVRQRDRRADRVHQDRMARDVPARAHPRPAFPRFAAGVWLAAP